MENETLKLNRILASLIDGFFMFVITVSMSIAPSISFFYGVRTNDLLPVDIFWFVFSLIASFLVWILYLSIPAFLMNGSTIGMKMTGLVFTSSKHKEIRFYHILFRETTLVVSIVLSLGLCILADLISTLASKEGKTYFDICSSLKVVSSHGA